MKKSFTLIELLIVVLIVGILATVALPQYTKVVEKAKWAEAVSMLGSIRQMCLLYYAEHSFYPNASAYTTINVDLEPTYSPVGDWLLLDVPAPDAGRYCYAIHNQNDVATWGRCAFAYYEKDGVPGWVGDPGDPYLEIDYNGDFHDQRGAPAF
ncbi:MAG: prepilin-type N-terminal cleavage/methylation domain-containing protein [Candidatus Omnitrophica bacterium]|nr:prepilin-type N-terminal cleavage/methylation domain-containing protein [Candidatus Omnitrophota bacterium]